MAHDAEIARASIQITILHVSLNEPLSTDIHTIFRLHP